MLWEERRNIMIDLLDAISDESLSAYIDGASNSFENIKIESMLPNSSELSEIIDIANDIKTFDIESFPLEENEFGDFDILTIEKLNKNVK